jgi:hypothetical protein
MDMRWRGAEHGIRSKQQAIQGTVPNKRTKATGKAKEAF